MMPRSNSTALTVLAALFIAQLVASPAMGASVLVQDGKPVGRILVPATPTKADTFAAEELQTYIRKITGATLPIDPGGTASGPAILIGDQDGTASVARDLKQHSADREAFAVVGQGDRLVLVGNGPTATVYAAWEWLGSLGVRWIMPTERGEYVPHKATLEIPSMQAFRAPRMTYRGPNAGVGARPGVPPAATALEHGVPASRLFSWRMRANSDTDFDLADAWATVGGGHSYAALLPPDRYFSQHPDWYSMRGGQRSSAAGWQICFTNRDAAREAARNLVAQAQAVLARGARIERLRLSVSPNDGPAWCDCPDCQKLVDSGQQATSMVVNFANMVATEVHKTYPAARIVFYAYANYTRPPEHVKPGPNVCPELTAWPDGASANVDQARPLFAPGNATYGSLFRAWAAQCDALSAYTYYGHYFWFTPWPQITQIANDLPAFAREPKCYGMTSEDHWNWGTQAPNFYLHYRMMWDPAVNVGDVLTDYYRAGFGPAAPYIQRYFEALQDRMDHLPRVGGNLREVTGLLTPSVIAQCTDLIGRARDQEAGMDAGTRWRTELLAQAWDASARVGRALRLYQAPNKTQADRQSIASELSAVLQFADSPDGLWAFDNAVVHAGIDPITRQMSAARDAPPPGTIIAAGLGSHGAGVASVHAAGATRAAAGPAPAARRQTGPASAPRHGSRPSSVGASRP